MSEDKGMAGMANAFDKMVADLKKHIAEYEESKMPIKRIHDESSILDDPETTEFPDVSYSPDQGIDGDTLDIVTKGTIGDIARLVNSIALKSGWWNKYEDMRFATTINGTAEKLLMIHTEVSEAVEDLRVSLSDTELTSITYESGDGKPCGFPTELADIIIRTLDLAEWLGIDIEDALVRKISHNQLRGFRHGDKNL